MHTKCNIALYVKQEAGYMAEPIGGGHSTAHPWHIHPHYDGTAKTECMECSLEESEESPGVSQRSNSRGLGLSCVEYREAQKGRFSGTQSSWGNAVIVWHSATTLSQLACAFTRASYFMCILNACDWQNI